MSRSIIVDLDVINLFSNFRLHAFRLFLIKFCRTFSSTVGVIRVVYVINVINKNTNGAVTRDQSNIESFGKVFNFVVFFFSTFC